LVEEPLKRLKAEPLEIGLAFVFGALNEILKNKSFGLEVQAEDRGCLPAAERRGAQLHRGGAVGGAGVAAERAVPI
jgi:hypothetical protein